ncbi:hypothetical protein ACFL5F_00855 [Planctomycetota bacterium]
MDERPTTFGLSPDKLAGLWNIGSDSDETEKAADPDIEKTELLEDMLSGPLPKHLPKATSRTKKQIHPKSIVNYLTDVPIEKLLNNPETDIVLLRKVKDHAKKLSGNAKSQAEYHVANTIYYASIASALIFHDRRITKFSYKDLEGYFQRLDQEQWLPEALHGLFMKACKYCRMRQGGS